MVRETACCSLLITVCLLLALTALASAQSEERRQRNPRDVTVVPTTPTASPGEQRTALVIGNSSYAEGPLANPVHDATDIASALQPMGSAVTLLRDADLRRMRDAIEAFRTQLHPGVVGLFYFAGHGLQVKGENYLVPIGAHIAREQDVEFETVEVRRILGAMKDAANGVNVIILDACRNNPFARGFRSSKRGLAVMQAITGSLIAYAPAPESVTADGSGRNGVYTSHLLKNIRLPGMPIEQVFKNVRIGVMQETGGKQIPWESLPLTGHVTFMPAAEQDPQVTVGTYAQPPQMPTATIVGKDGAEMSSVPVELVGTWSSVGGEATIRVTINANATYARAYQYETARCIVIKKIEITQQGRMNTRNDQITFVPEKDSYISTNCVGTPTSKPPNLSPSIHTWRVSVDAATRKPTLYLKDQSTGNEVVLAKR